MADRNDTTEEATRALWSQIYALKVLGDDTRAARNAATARNVLHEELGFFGEWDGAKYDLDDQVRDRLLAHTRQDAAHAVVNSEVAMTLAHKAIKLIGLFGGLSVVLLSQILLSIWL